MKQTVESRELQLQGRSGLLAQFHSSLSLSLCEVRVEDDREKEIKNGEELNIKIKFKKIEIIIELRKSL